jgi:hypothetical protein
MDFDKEKLVVWHFYEKYYEDLADFLSNLGCHDLAPSFDVVASVRLGELNPLEVEIKRINQDVAQSVSDAFARHIWYSQWNFANLFLVKIPIDEKSFFFLFHLGIIDDAWDNDTNLVEIFNEQGDFIGGIEGIRWSEEPFTHKDCRNGRTGAHPPPWSGDIHSEKPFWTEELLIRDGTKIEDEGTVTRYVLVFS